MSEPVFEAFARIRPILDPSFRQDAQQQIQQAVDAAQAAVKVTPRQALLGTAQTAKELSLSKSVGETEALSAAFKRLEIAGVASQERVAAAAVEVRTALGLTSTQGVAAQERLTAAALTTSKAIGGTGVAAQEAAQLQIAAQKRVQAAAAVPIVTPNLGQQAGLRSQGVQGQIASLAALKQQGFLTESAIASTSASITGLESAIGDLQKLRVGAGASVLTQIDAQLATLVPELTAARAGFQAVVAPVEQVTAATGRATKEAGLFGSRSALASAASAAGLQSVALRYGLVGLAATTAFQALGQAADALDQTGREAFTTEGRVRNLTAALIHQDLIGAFNGLTAVPKTIEEAGISIREASHNVEAFQRVIAGSQVDTSKKGLQEFDDAAREAGTSSRRLAQEVLDSIPAFAELDAATRTALNSVLALRDANNQPIPLGTFGAQTPGGTPFVPTLGGTSPTAADFAANNALTKEIALQRAQRQGDLQAESTLLQAQLKHAHYLVTITKGTGDLYRKRVAEEQRIKTALDSVHDQIVSNNEATKREAAAEKDRAKTAREQAARDALARAATARTVTETNLQNEVAKAALTARKTDDIRTTNALIEYLKKVRDNTDLEATVRADARKKITAARKNLQNVLKGEDPAAGPDDARRLKELQLSNAEAIAALSTRKSDDRKAILASITYYRNLTTTLRKAGKEVDAETAKAARISAQGRLKALKTTTAATGGASTEDFFKAAVANFRQFGSNISQNPNGILSPQDARGAFAAIALADPLVTAVDRGTSEQRKQTLLLGSIAGALGVGAKPPARSPKAPTTAAEEALRHSIFLHGV